MIIARDDLLRQRLLEQVEQAAPRVVIVAAPAGYGKTMLARQIAAGRPIRLTCDCASVDSPGALWYAVLTSIGSSPQPQGERAQRVHVGEGADPTLETTLAALDALEHPFALVFDNTEHVLAEPLLRRELQRFVAASPRTGTIVLCARTSSVKRMQASKFATPGESLVFRAADLVFDRAEIAEVLGEQRASNGLVDEVAAATSGWPVAVMFLRRFATQPQISAALRRFGESAFEQLHEYLIDEILGDLTDDELTAILCCAVVPDTSTDDLSRLLNVASVQELARELSVACPFFQRFGNDHFQLHPLLKSAIETRFGERRRAVACDLAAAYERESRYVRAGQIYRAIGDMEATARCLIAENSAPNRIRTLEYSALLATLDQAVLERFPILRALTIYWRRFRVDPHVLREHTEVVWEALRTSSNLELRANVGATIARIMYETGMFGRAEGLLRSLEDEFGGIPEVPFTAGQAYVARTLGCIAARSGRLEEAERYFRSGYLTRTGSELVQSRYFIERALIERLHGHATEDRRLLGIALESATAARAPVQTACALAEMAFGAWFWGDERAMSEHLERLAGYAKANGYTAFEHLCAVGGGTLDVAPNGTEQPNWLACAYLIAAGASAGVERMHHARAAKAAADSSHDAMLRVLGCLALAHAEAQRRDELLAEATAAANAIESPELQAAASAIVAAAPAEAMLAPFLARFSATATASASPEIRIEVLAQRVVRAGATIEIGEKQMALLVALGREKRPYTRSLLAEELWPQLDEAAAREALNSCVYRIRSRLGGSAVVFENDAYRLGDGIEVDLREFERWAAAVRRPGPLTAKERTALRTLLERPCPAPETLSETWEFLSPILVRMAQTRQAILERLAEDALAAGTPERALEIARELIASDPCDEQAREVAIRALLARGERPAALGELRDYQKILWRELEVRPSASLVALLREEPVPQPA